MGDAAKLNTDSIIARLLEGRALKKIKFLS